MPDDTHKNIHTALAAAQAEMGPVIKGTANPFFKSKYADLADVVDVVRPALNAHGICFYHTMSIEEGQICMATTLAHGDSETSVTCNVPLMNAQKDMQTMKSATTYAKRIGLESLSGIAPEDDDGNAASRQQKTRALPSGSVAPLDADEEYNTPAAKGQSRKLYAELQKQLRACSSSAELQAWGAGNAARLKTLPKDWYTEIKTEYAAELGAFIDHEAMETEDNTHAQQ